MTKSKDALNILARVTGSSESVKSGIAKARTNMEVAQMIYDVRTQAGLTQSQLAALIGSRQSVIARLEDADYSCPHPTSISPRKMLIGSLREF